MQRGRQVRQALLPYVLPALLFGTGVYCAYRALEDAGLGDVVRSGMVGGVIGGVGANVMSAVADRRALRRTKALLPAALTAAQRDLVVVAARRGPLPDDPAVRAEARRLADQHAAASGPSLRITVVVAALLVVALGVAGAVASPWWWGVGLVLGLVTALIVRRYRINTRHLHALRESTVLAPPPAGGLSRLVEAEPPLPPADSGQGLLQLELRRPFLGSLATTPLVKLNGQLVACEWGHNGYLVPGGAYRVAVSAEYITEYGQTTTTLGVEPGQQVVLHYSPPALTLLPGRTGSSLQPRPGALAVALVLGAFAALMLVLLVTGSW